MNIANWSSSRRALLEWLEGSWVASVLCGSVLAGVLTLGYLVGVPCAADLVASSVSLERERKMGHDALASLLVRQPSRIPLAEREAIESRFQELSAGLPLAPHYRLLFDGAPFANAYAFSGGTVMLTDGLIRKCSADEVVAILAHEIGHVEHRHGLRQVLRNSALSLLFEALASEAGSVSLSTSRLPRLLAITSYSREFETEADAFAIQLLRSRKLSPALLGSCLERIAPAGQEPGMWQFLSSHPHTAARAERSRAASSAAAQDGAR